MQQLLAVGPRVPASGSRRPVRRRHLHGSDLAWAIAFVAPYAVVFGAFVLWLVGYALWMAARPSLYADLTADPLYLPTVLNTLLLSASR
jgi:multiple sugar transport system permease protein